MRNLPTRKKSKNGASKRSLQLQKLCIDLFRPTVRTKYTCVIDQAWVQDGWILVRERFLAGLTREIPSGAHYACSSSQSQQRIRFILPARGFSHQCLVTLNGHIPEMLSPQDTWGEKRFLLQVVMKFADIVPTRKENKNSSVLEKNKIIL